MQYFPALFWRNCLKAVRRAAIAEFVVALKQFAFVALPFFALMVLALRPSRAALRNATAAFAAPLVVGVLPFLVAGPGAREGVQCRDGSSF